MAIDNNLYPPIVATWMPAFVRTNDCRVYFSLSSYNSLDEIHQKGIQVVISNQNSSLSAFDTSVYTSEIKLCTLNLDSSIDGDAKYYITISPDDLKSKSFEIGQYYKVQIRFTSIDIPSIPSSSTGIASWLSNYSSYFSEWSTVCLVHGIEQPLIYLREFSGTEGASLVIFNSTSLSLTGEMYYNSTYNEDESMYFYCVDLYNIETNSLIYSSGDIFTNEYYPNEINYVLKYNLDTEVEYQLQFTFETRNGYKEIKIFPNFMVNITSSETIDVTLTAIEDPDNGRIQIHVEENSPQVFADNIYICIRRASSETDFTIWEDIHIKLLTNYTSYSYDWYDYTAKSGVYYYYCILQIYNDGTRSGIVKTSTPVMLYLDDMFLTRNDMQLKVRFDPQISSYKITLSESKTDTIGSRYPRFMRNGNIAYKQFSISGLIMSYCDENQLFSSPEEFYGDMASYYNSFNEEQQYLIPQYQDFIYERNFREKIMKFLYDDNVKLFRSLTEGNILIKLMDINFTPNQTLGRMLYSFSATAYEIDECSIENYNTYGILDIGEFTSGLVNYSATHYEETKLGEIADEFDANENIYDYIIDHFESQSLSGYMYIVTSITCLKIDFQSSPYLIITNNNGSLIPATFGDQYSEDMVYGYIVYINGKAFLVSSRGYFVVDPDIEITSISFPVVTTAHIDFTAQIYSQAITLLNEIKPLAVSSYYIEVGQISGMFNVEESISDIISLKYNFDDNTSFQKFLSIDEVTIEANPGTICYIKNSFENDYSRYIVGKTSILHLYNKDTVIAAMYVAGIHLNLMKDDTRLIPEIEEYRDTGIIVANVEDITNPQEKGVYTITNGIKTINLQELATNTQNRYIYITNTWYSFSDNNDVLCPVEAIITYIYEIEKGSYA